jgi:phosphate transport system substrate-binding protein
MKYVKIGAIFASSLFLLTACDPPIPQSLLVEQAEREVVCGEPGEISVYMDPGFVDLIDTWSAPLTTGCPNLSIYTSETSTEAQVVASLFPAPCEPVASAPMAYEAAAIAFYLDEAFSINLSGEAVQGIFSGTITNWSDPVLTDLNPDAELPNLAIEVIPNSASALIATMENWTEELTGTAANFSLLQDDPAVYFSDLIFEMTPGSIGLFPLSEVSGAGATFADIETPDGILLADQQSIYAASTMFNTETKGQSIEAKFDLQATPMPSPGTSEAALPYKALAPIYISICGEDSLAVRAVARYSVRLDAQGLVATTPLVALEEKVRVASAGVLETGLPVPEVVPAEN